MKRRGKHEGRVSDEAADCTTLLRGCNDAIRAFESNALRKGHADAARHFVIAREHVANAIERVQQGLAELPSEEGTEHR